MITLFHGSKNIITKPSYGIGNIHNDYGMAFYCTKHIELAKEWAVTEQSSGFANMYSMNLDGLDVLDLGNGDYSVLNWLAILLENRTFRTNTDASAGKDYIIDNFLPSYKKTDVIKGYRADDSYFSYANAFLNNSVSLEKLYAVMQLGDLGIQFAIKSENAFNRLTFLDALPANKLEYYPRKKARDEKARDMYSQFQKTAEDGIYMIDIYRQKWRHDDERLQRIIFR